MSNETQQHDIAAVRQLLLAAFTPEELRRFCYDHPTFRPVVNRFGPGHGHDDMVDELVTYCDNYRFFPELLAEIKQANPRQYAHYVEPERSEHETAPPTLEILTITSPISLHLIRVPAGEFQMGSIAARDKLALDAELPPHPVRLPEFHIGRYPVTNTQYQAFVQATGHRAPDHWERGRMPGSKYNHPVVRVSWQDALTFCAWLAQESGQPIRLPTEAEWEKAARGTDGRIYPWGDEMPDRECCNFDNDDKDTTTIGRYSPQGDSPFGCADMAGNVSEWCQSLFSPYPYQAGDGRENPDQEGSRVLRGGAFFDDERGVRCAYRKGGDPTFWLDHIGFRVVAAPGSSDF